MSLLANNGILNILQLMGFLKSNNGFAARHFAPCLLVETTLTYARRLLATPKGKFRPDFACLCNCPQKKTPIDTSSSLKSAGIADVGRKKGES